jgi:hypothetical protein
MTYQPQIPTPGDAERIAGLVTLNAGLPRGVRAAIDVLLSPAAPEGLSVRDRRAVAVFASALLGDLPSRARFEALLAEPRLSRLLLAEADGASRPGPYGSFPPAPLTAADLDGPPYRAPDSLGEPLTAALEHVHLLLTHPGEAASVRLPLAARRTTERIVGVVTLAAQLSAGIVGQDHPVLAAE